MANVTAQEQLMLELVNRARLDPLAEAQRLGIDLNQGLAAGTISATPKHALAMNDFLVTAADGHSAWMIAADVFSHTGQSGSTATQRMTAAGYSFTGSWSSGENISWVGTFPGPINPTTAIIQQHDNLFLSPGHRKNIMSTSFREIGIGQDTGLFFADGTDWSSSLVTQNFALSGSNFFLTGVIYNDTINNDFYDIGEGSGGVSVSITGGGSDVSSAAGGYEIATGAGAKAVTIGAVALGLTVGSGNVKLDLVNGTEVWTDTTVAVVSGATAINLIGMANTSATGGSAAERITGNKGANGLDGGGGHDTISGGAGNDFLVGGAGNDSLNGGTDFDYASYFDATGGISVSLAVATGQAVGAGLGTDTLSGIEGLFGSQHADTLTGDGAAVNAIYAWGGADSVSGGGGFDYIEGGEGHDTIDGGAGNDFLLGGNGLDTLTYANESAGIYVNMSGAGHFGNGTSAGFDVLSSIERVVGTSHDDFLFGSAGVDTLVGGGGVDVLYGFGAGDSLDGGSATDYIVGGTGSDTITTGSGQDFIYFQGQNEGVDIITDWRVSGFDIIVIDEPAFGGGLTAGQYLNTQAGRFVNGATATAATGQFLWNSATSTLSWDADGTGGGAAVQLAILTGITSLTGADILVL